VLTVSLSEAELATLISASAGRVQRAMAETVNERIKVFPMETGGLGLESPEDDAGAQTVNIFF
jgi:hypothetical protein